MNSRHRHITTGRSVTAFENDVFIALTFVVLLLCSANAQQQPVNVPSASLDPAVAWATVADYKTRQKGDWHTPALLQYGLEFHRARPDLSASEVMSRMQAADDLATNEDFFAAYESNPLQWIQLYQQASRDPVARELADTWLGARLATPKATDNDSARILESAPELASALRTLASQTRADAVPLDRKPYAALVIGSGVDLATSLHALAHTPGAHESNPLLAHGGTRGLVAGKVATTAGLVWAMQRFAKGGHPTLAKVIGWTGGIALSGVALHNARTR